MLQKKTNKEEKFDLYLKKFISEIKKQILTQEELYTNSSSSSSSLCVYYSLEYGRFPKEVRDMEAGKQLCLELYSLINEENFLKIVEKVSGNYSFYDPQGHFEKSFEDDYLRQERKLRDKGKLSSYEVTNLVKNFVFSTVSKFEELYLEIHKSANKKILDVVIVDKSTFYHKILNPNEGNFLAKLPIDILKKILGFSLINCKRANEKLTKTEENLNNYLLQDIANIGENSAISSCFRKIEKYRQRS